mmetsp:Transcript_21158/g.63358  ORF Transcript_21158/g.63358 Transcript_21158/m.63358 type:complete len:317 (+) Transcript_21158:3211-4161(+)
MEVAIGPYDRLLAPHMQLKRRHGVSPQQALQNGPQLRARVHPIREGLVRGRARVKRGAEQVAGERDEHVVAFQVLEAHAHEGVALALAYFLEEARAVRVDALAEVLHGRACVDDCIQDVLGLGALVERAQQRAHDAVEPALELLRAALPRGFGLHLAEVDLAEPSKPLGRADSWPLFDRERLDLAQVQQAGDDHAGGCAATAHLAVEHERAAQLHIPDPVDKHLKVLILGCLFIRDRNAQVVDVVAIGDELIKDLARCLHVCCRDRLPVVIEREVAVFVHHKDLVVHALCLRQDVQLQSLLHILHTRAVNACVLEV